ncbi:MAG: energy transducer TonB [Thermodesulfobacteriota bacterium]
MSLALTHAPLRGRWGLALAGSLVLNLVIFGAAALLLQGEPARPRLEAYHVSAFLPLPPPPPPKEEQEPPPPPPPKPLRLSQLQAAPQARPAVEAPPIALELGPKLSLGPVLAPPGPPGPPALGPGDREPLVAAQMPPPYPYLARRRGIEGAVTVRFLVDRQGRVQHLSVLGANPPGVFEETVLRTVPHWRFRPGLRQGQAVEAWVETTIRFKLEGR